jgi:hypothetical protein
LITHIQTHGRTPLLEPYLLELNLSELTLTELNSI